MKIDGLRAVVFSAGRGTRLRPLTNTLPKPLLPLRGRPILAHTLDQLADLGCEAVAINVHHLGEKIPESIGENWKGVPLTYSHEEELLGTLGALAKLTPFLSEAREILVVNGDSLCRWPFLALLRRHRKRGHDATLLLTSSVDPLSYGGGVGIDREGLIVDFGIGEAAETVVKRHVFAGAHVFSPDFLGELEEKPACIVRDHYLPRLAEGALLGSLVSRRAWHDLGTPSRYLDGTLHPPKSRWWKSKKSWVADSTSLGEGVRVDSSVIEEGVEISEGCEIRSSLILPGARLAKGCKLDEAIVDFGTTLPPGTILRRRLVTPAIPGRDLGIDSSQLGGIAYIPLDPRGRKEEE